MTRKPITNKQVTGNMTQNQMTANINRAEQYINTHQQAVTHSPMRQKYHFMGPCGWINDPNGLIYFRNKYHFFYQFNPYGPCWSEMYWGHATSDDLVHWHREPIALAPSEVYDDHPQGGCFSGSAIEKEGKLYLFYTGTANLGAGLEQSQNIAVSDDGIHFVKFAGNPVISAPADFRRDCFRDPKVWRHEDTYYLLCGASKNGRAAALLYRSDDLLHWKFFNVLMESHGEWGTMWECPDIFPIGGKWVFLCSPVGAGSRKTVYFTGDLDYERGVFLPECSDEIDWGYDFYAPQTLQDPQGRRILVGWANGWEWMPFWKDWGPTYRDGWTGSFSLPRMVSLNKLGKLSFSPIKELQSLRKESNHLKNLVVTARNEKTLKAGDGVCFELALTCDLSKSTASSFELLLRSNGEMATCCRFDLLRFALTIDRNKSDGWSTGICSGPLNLYKKNQLYIQIFSDQSSLELFINEGEEVYSLNIFAPENQNKLAIRSNNGTVVFSQVESFGMISTE